MAKLCVRSAAAAVAGPFSRGRLLLAVVLAAVLAAPAADAATFTVTTPANNGNASLRGAITRANASPGADRIVFNVNPGGTISINLLNQLPPITDEVVIDGTTQPGWIGPPIVELDGTPAGPGTSGLVIQAANVTVRGLVVNRFGRAGILVSPLATGTKIFGNHLGTSPSGLVDLGNGASGIELGGSSAVVGGSSAADRNVVSGNDGHGILVTGAGNSVTGNLVGVAASGLVALGNTGAGVHVSGGTANTIAENTIASVGAGVVLDAGSGNTLAQNAIGTDAAGSADLGTHGAGVLIANGSGDNALEDNTIAFTRAVPGGLNGSGVVVASGVGNTISGNAFRTNAGLAIDLGGDGPTANDGGAANDSDAGPNDLLNLPALGLAALNGAKLTVTGSIDSTPNETPGFTVEILAREAGADDQDAERSLGTGTVPTGVTGEASFTLPLDVQPGDVDDGDIVVATSTDGDGNTSELSAGVAVVKSAVTAEVSIAPEPGSETVSPPARVELADVPAETFIAAAQAALNAAALGSTPIGSIPIGSIPIGSIPIGSIGFLEPQIRALLGGVLLSSVPLAPPSSWDALLQGTSLTGIPLQTVTLQEALDALAAQPSGIAGVPIGSISLENSILGSLLTEAIGLGATPIGSIGIGDEGTDEPGDTNLDDWCEWLSGPPVNCTIPSSLAGESVLSLSLQGTPIGSIPIGSIPIGSIPIGSIPIGSISILAANVEFSPIGSIPIGSIPIGSIPIGSIPIGSIPIGSIDLQGSPIGSIPIGSIPIGSIATLFTCSPACPSSGTIRDHAGQLQTGLTLESLMRAVGTAALGDIGFSDVLAFVDAATLEGYTILELVETLLLIPDNGVTLADLLAAFLAETSLGWEQLDLAGARINEIAADGGTAHYRVDVELTPDAPGGVGAPSTATVTVRLPEGFAYVPGSSTLVDTGQALPPTPVAEPAVAGDTLTWTLALTVGPHYRLAFAAYPGTTLGPALAHVEATAVGAPTAAGPAPGVVSIEDTFEPNGDAGGPVTAVETTSFYLSYITSADDVDYFSYPVPSVPGTKVTFRLSHLPADYDLVVYGPAGQVLRPQQPGTEPLDGQPLDDDGPSLTSAFEALDQETLDDLALANLPVLGVSTLRGLDDDAATVVSDGVAGSYVVQVTGFNGVSSPEPYMLRPEERAPVALPACQPRPFPHTGTNAGSLLRGPVPAGVDTVLVVNKAQWERVYGPAAVAAALTSLDGLMGELAADGHPSAILQVDADPDVQASVATWNACPTDLTRANAVVREVALAVDLFRSQHLGPGSSSSVENIVLLGGDEVIPAARLEDRTTVANEAGYAETFASGSDLATLLRAGYFLSDDPYGDIDPIPFFDRQLHIPDVAVGRLPTTPADAVGAITRFTDFDGVLEPATAVTTGYDFLSDGAQEVDAGLRAIQGIGGTNPAGLIGDLWDRNALIAGFLPGGVPPDLASINGHADHRALLPAAGTALFGLDDLPPTGGAAGAFDGKVVFSMGCHAGLSVSDVFVVSPLGTGDWAQAYGARGAVYAGNTGYGYGDGALVAYSEDLQRRFAENLGGNAAPGDLTVGEALVLAKQDYFGELGVVGVYDEKASSEFTLYGLPMWHVGGTGAAAASATEATGAASAADAVTPLSLPEQQSLVVDPATGLTAEELTNDWSPPAPTAVPGGQYVAGEDGVLVEHFRPVQPKTVLPLTIPSAHGALLTELSSTSTTPFDPYFARPLVDSVAGEPLLDWDRLVHPAKLHTVTTSKLGTVKRHRLVLATGQFAGSSGGDETGTQRLFTHQRALVFSAPGASADYAKPVLGRISATRVGATVAFAVDTKDRAPNGPDDVVRVLVAYLDEPDGGVTRSWKFVDLVRTPSSDRWSGTGALVSATAQFQYFVQAVDRAGNVAVSTNKGVFYEAAATPPPVLGELAIVAPTAPPSGWFGGDVVITLTVGGAPATAADNLVTSADGGLFELYDGPLTVAGDGSHIVTARAPDGTEVALAVHIDTAPPTIVIATPAAGAQYVQGQPVVADYSCLDAGAGVDPSACVGSVPDGGPVDTSTVGPKTFSVSAVDRVGQSAAATAAYTVVAPPPVTITSSPPPVSSATTATFAFSSSVPGATFECKLDGGAYAACTSPRTYSELAPGSHTFTVRASYAGISGPPAAVTWTIVTTLAGRVVFARGPATDHDLWVLDPTGASPPWQLTSGPADDVQPALSPDGKTVLFARRTTTNGPYELWRADPAGLGLAAIMTVGTNSAPAWSRDGTKVAWDSTRTGSKGTDVFSAPWQPATKTLGPETNLTKANGNDVTPSWAPTGAQIAFASNRQQSQYDLYEMDADGTNPRRLTSDKATDVEPAWSPDGTKIAFSSDREGGPGGFELYVLRAPQGTHERVASSPGPDGQPHWLSDATVLFVSARSGGGLFTVASTGGAVSKLPGTSAGDIQPG